jgi:hypothetical protein
MRKGQNAADSRGDIGASVSIVVNVVKLPNEFQLETSVPNDLVPYLEVAR